MVPRQPSHHRHHPSSAPVTNNTSDTTNKQPRDPSPAIAYHADDERSSTSMGSISLNEPSDLPPPSYPGEDTRPTSQKELLGFYTYSWAAEVFVVCGLGAFIPITLEDLARASATAVLATDHSKPCKAMKIEASGPDVLKNHAGTQCVFKVLGTEINTASFAMYTFSVSVLLQALVVVTMSGAADHGRYRKQLLIIFAVVGAIATMLFLPVTPGVYLFASLWAVIGNVCFGASFVLLNSFLPLLVRHHPAGKNRITIFADRIPVTYEDVSETKSIRHRDSFQQNSNSS